MRNPASGTRLGSRPRNVLLFELLMYASIVVSLASTIGLADFSTIVSLATAFTVTTSVALPHAVKIPLLYLAAHRRVAWARAALAVLFLLHLLSAASLVGLDPWHWTSVFLGISALLIEAAAICFAYTRSVNQWLDPDSRTNGPLHKDRGGNEIWKKTIPRINTVTMILCCGILLTVDVPILIASLESSAGALLVFFYMMVGVLLFFSAIYYVENFRFAPKLALSSSSLDTSLVGMIVLRNCIFVLNVIPGIQLIGIAALAFIGIPMLAIYALRIRKRLQAT